MATIEETNEKIQKENKELEEAFNRVFNTNDGKMLGRWLIKNCGFSEGSIVVDSNGNISTDYTIYNEARRVVYLELRKFLNPDTLINLEIKEE
jgi:hypothetical protein